jgi:glycosyltransferase involved in cell wall biosynthesis
MIKSKAQVGRRGADLVVVVNGFPRLSETFVLHELLELERRGLRIYLVALTQPDEIVQQEALGELRADVEHLPESHEETSRTLLRTAKASLFLRRPVGYLDGLVEVTSSPDFSKGSFRRALILAHRIARLGAPPVYVHFAHKPATVGRFAALLAGVPYALSAHAKDIWLTPPQELKRKVRDAKIVLTCTSEGAGYLEQLADGHTPVTLAYHGVDLTRPARPEPGNRVPVILSVGRLVEKKGHATLVAAAGLLHRQGVDFQLRIGGEGPEWAALQRLVHQLGIGDKVVFLGPLAESEVWTEHLGADVFALACRQLDNGDRDGIPNVILEAMAQGIPVVSTSVDGVAEAIVDGRSGLLVVPGDAEALAAKLALVLRDQALRAQLGHAGRARVAEQFDRTTSLSAVVETLMRAGIVQDSRPGEPAGEQPHRLRAVA